MKDFNTEVETLKRKIETTSNQDEKAKLEKQITYYQTFSQIASKYNWATAWNLNAVFERRDKTLFTDTVS